MVATVVLEVEVTVSALRENDFGQPALDALLLVPEFVGCVDADSGRHTDRHCESDIGENAQIPTRPDVAGQEEGRVLQRQIGVGAPPVEAVVLEFVDHLVGRILPVLTRQDVDDGNESKRDQWAGPPEDIPSGGGNKPHGDESCR